MKSLNKYLKNREAAINFLLSKPRREFTPGTFHKLRVEIKKLNALCVLINFCAKDFNRKKTIKPFKLIFRQAGKVRDLQLEESMIKKYLINNSLNDYVKSLRKLQLKEQNIFFDMMDNNLSNHLRKKYHRVVSFLDAVDRKRANNYIERRTKSIKKLVGQPSIQLQALHVLRKLLKIFNYCKKILSQEDRSKSVTKNDDLQVLLGNWHDCRIVLRNVKRRMETGGVNPKEIRQLDKVKTKIISASEIIFRKIKTGLPKSEFYN